MRTTAAVILLAAALALAGLWSLGIGSAGIPPLRAAEILWQGGADRDALLVLTVRLPRLLAAMLAGAALAVAGGLLQRLLGNPLADPGLVGVNAGAALAVVALGALTGIGGRGAHVWAAFACGIGAAALVWTMAGGLRASPIRLILAGVICGSFLMALVTLALLLDAARLDALRFWTVGSLTGAQMAELAGVLPWAMAGLIGAGLAARPLDIIAMGEDTARALGLRVTLWRVISLASAVALAAAAVAAAGPLGFLGLIAPHAARLTIGPGAARGLVFWALGGALLAVLADALPRAITGHDVPVGLSLGVIGAPVFLLIAMRARR